MNWQQCLVRALSSEADFREHLRSCFNESEAVPGDQSAGCMVGRLVGAGNCYWDSA